MKLKLLYLAFLLLPFTASAQNEPPEVLKNFEESTERGINSVSTINEHTKLLLACKNDEKFDLIAITDKMQALWKTTLKGYVFKTGLFKGNVFAIAATDHSSVKGTNNTYNGYLLDAATGKILVQKEVFHDADSYQEFPLIFTDEKGSFLKMLVRQTAVERKLFTMSRAGGDKVTRDLTLIDFDEHLQPTSAIKPKVIDGQFAGTTGNNHGDVFICWFKPNNTLVMIKYATGKQDVEGITGRDLDLGLSTDKDGTRYKFEIFPSESQPDAVYFTLANYISRGERQFEIGKYSFLTNKTDFIKDPLVRAHLKDLEKTLVIDNSEIKSRPDFAQPEDMEIKFSGEKNGNVIIAFTPVFFEPGYSKPHLVEKSLLINVYDADLNLKFQQGLPHVTNTFGASLETGLHFDGNYLYTIANDDEGLRSYKTIFGKLNLLTGRWEVVKWLNKKKIGSSDAAAGERVLWFADNYILPYYDIGGMTSIKYDIALAKYHY